MSDLNSRAGEGQGCGYFLAVVIVAALALGALVLVSLR